MPRRIVTSIIVLLIIGAAINVLVAWICVTLARTRMFDAIALGRMRAEQYAAEDEMAAQRGSPNTKRYLALLFLAPGTRVLIVDESGDTQNRRISTQSAGWPWLALAADQARDRGQPLTTRWGVAMGTMTLDYPVLNIGSSGPPAFPASRPVIVGPPAPPPAVTVVAPIIRPAPTPVTAAPVMGQQADRLLPMRPVWPGFALNTMIYASAAWILWLIWTATLRTQRRLRGMCGRCAYPVGTSPICTECGHRVWPRGASG